MLNQDTEVIDNIIYASKLPTLGRDPWQILQAKQKRTAAVLRILQGLLRRHSAWDQQSSRWYILHRYQLSHSHRLQFTTPEKLLC